MELSHDSFSDLAGADASIEIHGLQYCMSRETLTIVDNVGLTESQKDDEAQIIAALKQYVQGRINETVEHRYLRGADRHQVKHSMTI